MKKMFILWLMGLIFIGLVATGVLWTLYEHHAILQDYSDVEQPLKANIMNKWIEMAKAGQKYVITDEVKREIEIMEGILEPLRTIPGARTTILYYVDVDGTEVNAVAPGLEYDGVMMLVTCSETDGVKSYSFDAPIEYSPYGHGFVYTNDRNGSEMPITPADLQDWADFNKAKIEAHDAMIARYKAEREGIIKRLQAIGSMASHKSENEDLDLFRLEGCGLIGQAVIYAQKSHLYFEIHKDIPRSPEAFRLFSHNYYGKEGAENLTKDINFISEMLSELEQGNTQEVKTRLEDWQHELNQWLALNKQVCGDGESGTEEAAN